MNKPLSKSIKFLLAILLLLTSAVPTALSSAQLESNLDLSAGSVQPQGNDTIEATAATNATHPILSELQVRQAIAYCTDREALVVAAYPDRENDQDAINELLVDSFLVKTHWAYISPTTQYPHDPDQGKTMLDAAGWTVPEGETYRVNAAGDMLALKLTTSDADFRLAWAQEFEGQMNNCGIWVIRLLVDPPWLFGGKTGLFRRDFEMIGYTNLANEDEPEFYKLFGCDQIPSAQNDWEGYNFNGWCNETASQAAKIAANTEISQTLRITATQTLQNEYANDMPSLPLFMREEGGAIERIDFNFDTPPPPHPALNEPQVRQAIAYCTNREALAKAVYPDIDVLMIDSFLTTDHWAYSSPAAQYPSDPEQGKAMLDAIGWTVPISETYRENAAGDRLALKLSTTSAGSRIIWAEVFEGQMKDCGIQVVSFHLPSSWLFGEKTGISHRDFELGGWASSTDEDLDVVSRFGCDQIPSAENDWQGKNYVGWCNQTASQAAEIASNTEISQTLRITAAKTLQNEFANDMPALPLYIRSGSAIEFVEFNMVPPDTSTSAVITPEVGGALTSTVNLTTTLTFPAGAVSEPVTVTHDITATHTISSGFQFVGQNFSIEAFTAGGTPVTSFTEPFTITIQYSDADIFGVDEESLVLSYWNTKTGNWEEIPTTLDMESNTITALLDHLTDFGIVGERQMHIYLPVILLKD